MAGSSQRLCPQCSEVIYNIRNGLYACDRCQWEGVETPVYYIEFMTASSTENRQPIYQGNWR